jgi:hypothetical protein
VNDDELGRQVGLALREMFPEPVDSTPHLPPARARRWPVAAAAASVAAVLAVGLAVAVPHNGSSGGGQPVPQASPTHRPISPAGPTLCCPRPVVPPAPAVPRWVSRCLPVPADRRGPAPEYLGLSFRQAWRLAERRGDALVLAGSGGRCDHSSDDVYRPNPVAVVFDRHIFRRHPNAHRDPRNPRARVIAAERATPGWDGAHR